MTSGWLVPVVMAARGWTFSRRTQCDAVVSVPFNFLGFNHKELILCLTVWFKKGKKFLVGYSFIFIQFGTDDHLMKFLSWDSFVHIE